MSSIPTTPNLGLALIPSGTTNWAALYQAAMTAIDTAVHALQTGGTTGPEGPPGAPGPVGLVFTGPWTSTTAYTAAAGTTPACIVTYNGSTYLAIANNTNMQPDVNTSTWSVIAAAGAQGVQGETGSQGLQGLQGIQGPPGTPGTNATLTLPVTVAEGGTGAIDPADARTNLGAAASGINADITELTALTAPTAPGASSAITINSPGGNGNALTVSNGVSSGGIRSDASAFFTSIEVQNGILAGTLQISGLFEIGEIGNTIPGTPIQVVAPTNFADGLTVQGAAPAAASGQLSIGATTATSATAGTGPAMPATVEGFMVWNLGGLTIKIPFLLA